MTQIKPRYMKGDRVYVKDVGEGSFSGDATVYSEYHDIADWWVVRFDEMQGPNHDVAYFEMPSWRLTGLLDANRDPGDETDSALKTAPSEDADAYSESFRFFETLLDSAEEAHPSSKLFYNELIEAGLLHAQKQRDYGKPADPFANVRSSEEWGIPGWVGAMVRLNDKVKRLQSLARTGGLANESAIDSFRDIAVYALIALVLYGQESA